MVGRVLDLNDVLRDIKDREAVSISNKFMEWNSLRAEWMRQKAELRNYLFATDTTTTSNKRLPWKNSTTVPKLTQIRDNLHANYMAALFPNSDWLRWEGNEAGDEIEKKRSAIEAYMRTKARQDRLDVQVSRVLLDYIDDGNCFAMASWADDSVVDYLTGETVRGYVGPRMVRISPFDIVFNPVAADFAQTPKIIRSITTLGELEKRAMGMPPNSDEQLMLTHALQRGVDVRREVASLAPGDTFKSDGYQMDGFSSIQQYYGTDYVEVLTFYGDLYDIQTGVLCENHIITIMDRSFVISKKPNPAWAVGSGIRHAGWRLRPDNLYAMGPLDNLVGMQYRIDHLENLKADVFDMIAYPVQKIKGLVEDYTYEPGCRIFVGDDGDVEFMHPPEAALNADNQIELLERRMEELAGAPREAMGIRTPGEKTKFEVQLLDNAASRIFLNKIMHFEKVFFEPILNDMLMVARANMSASDVVRTLDSEIDAVVFSSVTKDDLAANGILRPQGASHFAQRANTLQNLVSMLNSAVGMDPAVKTHLSGKKIAKLLEELSDLEKYKIYGDNVRVVEQAETQRLMHQMGEQTDIQSQTPPGILEGDPASAEAAVGPTG